MERFATYLKSFPCYIFAGAPTKTMNYHSVRFLQGIDVALTSNECAMLFQNCFNVRHQRGFSYSFLQCRKVLIYSYSILFQCSFTKLRLKFWFE